MRHCVVLLTLLSTTTVASANHCTAQELTVFSCGLARSAKVVSLCASKPLSGPRGHLTFSFGLPGQVELAFPPSAVGSFQQFRHAHYGRFQTSRTEVSFTVGGYNYTLFDYHDALETPQRVRGLSVGTANSNGPDTQRLCGRNATSRLNLLEGLLPCDADNALASCP